MHRVGGLEKQDGTGEVSYDPDNHQHMVETRAKKVALAADFIEPLEVFGKESGTLVISWGGTYGSCHTAVEQSIAAGIEVGHAHLRWINPFPRNLGEIIARYDRVLVPELNNGQLRLLLKNEFLCDAIGLNKIKGKPFHISEIMEKIAEISK